MLPISSNSATQAASATNQPASSQLNVDYENFLQLLTAQISNQDPLAPMESTEFVSQLAQLSQVEQSIQTNANLETLSATMSATAVKSDLGLLGHDVLVASDQLQNDGGGARIGYRLSEEVTQVAITIRNGSGQVVKRLTGSSGQAGELHELTWDGSTQSGDPAATGLYQISVTGLTQDGGQVSGEPFVQTGVEAISFESGASVLHLANGEIGHADDIVQIR